MGLEVIFAVKSDLLGKERISAHKMGSIVEVLVYNHFGEPEFIQMSRPEWAKIQITEQPFF